MDLQHRVAEMLPYFLANELKFQKYHLDNWHHVCNTNDTTAMRERTYESAQKMEDVLDVTRSRIFKLEQALQAPALWLSEHPVLQRVMAYWNKQTLSDPGMYNRVCDSVYDVCALFLSIEFDLDHTLPHRRRVRHHREDFIRKHLRRYPIPDNVDQLYMIVELLIRDDESAFLNTNKT
jgi:hypothetical protein